MIKRLLSKPQSVDYIIDFLVNEHFPNIIMMLGGISVNRLGPVTLYCH
jgi:hypothetical protein